MNSKINKLLEKYWEGETSIEEEQELKSLLSKSEGFEEEKLFFGDLATVSNLTTDKINVPNRIISGWQYWSKLAALLILFLIATTAVYRYQERKAKREAFLAVMEAFELINGNMQKGTSQLEVMEDFKHLNTSHEIFNLNEEKQ
jgi:hypothetical protein